MIKSTKKIGINSKNREKTEKLKRNDHIISEKTI